MQKFIILPLLIALFMSFPQTANAQSGSCACARGSCSTHACIPPLIVSSNNCANEYLATCSTDWDGNISRLPEENISCTCVQSVPGTNCGATGQVAINGICCDPQARIEARSGVCLTSQSPASDSFKMCDIIKDSTQNQLCTDCLTGNGVWTALGCLHFNPKDFVIDFLRISMGVAGGIALLLMVYGSFLISTSAGDPKKSEEGKEIITGTIAGLLFIIFSVFLLKFIGVNILNIPGLM